jgi:hypothetical protein
VRIEQALANSLRGRAIDPSMLPPHTTAAPRTPRRALPVVEL